jgi:hypothetical protein
MFRDGAIFRSVTALLEHRFRRDRRDDGGDLFSRLDDANRTPVTGRKGNRLP